MLAHSNVCIVDMKEIENAVRSIERDGLLWGACECYSTVRQGTNIGDAV